MNTENNLSSKIVGDDYLSAYRSRMEVNNQYFIDTAYKLTEMGYNVYVPKDGLINFIRVESEKEQVLFGFADVPYRWYLSCDINYKLGNGSSKTLNEGFNYDYPFTVAEILNNMQPKVPTQLKAPAYLQLFTIL